eukprot:Anaeramoba_ignava/a218725_473.p1 GENE.a218725_473~~a218725_473.p1  ORF type:complete len:1063 (-),score=285.44 a218725_473:31-3219(-)
MSDALQGLTETINILAALLFIFSLYGLRHQETSKKGNFYGMGGMVIAIVALLFSENIKGSGYIVFVIALVPGLIIGLIMAIRVKMTGMPQMVGILNSFGGLAAFLASVSMYLDPGISSTFKGAEMLLLKIFLILGVSIGIITFVGSVFACLKLQGLPGFRGVLQLPGKHFINTILLLGIIGVAVPFVMDDVPNGMWALGIVTALSALYGFHFVMCIGGADMPVVISMLNSMSGWAGVMAGFSVSNDLLITTGSLVGSSGAILSYIMCRAMNRSFLNVFKGGEIAKKPKKGMEQIKEKEPEIYVETNVDEMAQTLLDSKKILITPGYGMAVSQAQHLVSEISKHLRSRGKEVIFGIHPVAGRLPGHMNVLLAEAQVPYDIVLSMDEVNPTIADNDLAIVIGANDTVNPSAVEDPHSAIAGMPVIEVWKAKQVVVIKRTMGHKGYAGIPNPLFYKPNTKMLLGDAKEQISCLLSKIKDIEKQRGVKDSDQIADFDSKCKVDQESKTDTDWVDLDEFETTELETELETYRKIGVVKEIKPNETRVAITPDIAQKLVKKGFEILVETGAGVLANFSDSDYRRFGATILPSASKVWKQADIVLKLEPPMLNNETGVHELDLLPEGGMFASFIYPSQNEDLLERLKHRKVTALSMELVPRITRAQKLDALSSMAKVGGYRAVIESAYHFEKFFLGEVTAAGKYPPAIVMIIGAGVAGLGAIGTAKNLGAIVRAFDTRPVVKEQVESMGGEFLELDFKEDGTGVGGYAKVMSEEFIAAEMRLFAQQAREVDIIITTAQIPGRKAPLLIKKEHVDVMKKGSVIVDMAAQSGGNCEVTRPGEIYKYNGVTVIGLTDLPSKLSTQSSQMYATNLLNLMEEMGNAKNFTFDLENEIIDGMCVSHNGTLRWPKPKPPTPAPAPEPEKKSGPDVPPSPQPPAIKQKKPKSLGRKIFDTTLFWLIAIAIFSLIGIYAPDSFLPHLGILALACVVGWTLVWGVAAALHTPLMSVTNAISGIVILGGMTLVSNQAYTHQSTLLAAFSIFVASINIAGGFLVTQKMLLMFKTEEKVIAN